jgi:hypothetical protein
MAGLVHGREVAAGGDRQAVRHPAFGDRQSAEADMTPGEVTLRMEFDILCLPPPSAWRLDRLRQGQAA